MVLCESYLPNAANEILVGAPKADLGRGETCLSPQTSQGKVTDMLRALASQTEYMHRTLRVPNDECGC